MASFFTKDGNWTRQSLIVVLDRVGIATLVWLFVGVTLGFSIGATLLAAQSANRTEAERAQSGVEFRLADELDELTRVSSDFGYWDEAVVHLAEHLDPDWADANIGSYMHRQHRVDATFVIAPDAGMVIGFVDGTQVEAGLYGP
jgi:sensor domain CHASE-containing protein